MLAAAALVAYLIKPGDTLSGIAASHGAKLAAVEAANPQIKNFNVIYPGQTIKLPKGSSASHRSHTPSVHTSAHSHRAPSHRSSSHTTHTVTRSYSSGYSSSDLADIPGVPRSYAACVAYRESTDLRNPAARGNAYGIIPASGYDGYHMTLSQQKQVFAKLYREYGTRPWSSDGC